MIPSQRTKPIPQAFQSQNLSQLSHIAHGFFGREGGVSQGLYASLNTGYGSNDKGAAVTQNRNLCLEALGQENSALLTVNQVHGNHVISVTSPWQRENTPRADALVTKQSGIMLGVLTADCAPILLADPRQNIVGAVHSGWRGTQLGIAVETIKAMEKLGADRREIVATIGPCIHQKSYEVDQPFLAHFADAPNFFRPAIMAGRYLFDLPGYICNQLEKAGIGAIDTLPLDSYQHDGKFFSYRRSRHDKEADYGRQIAIIGLR